LTGSALQSPSAVTSGAVTRLILASVSGLRR